MPSRNSTNVDVDCYPCLLNVVPSAVLCLSLSFVCVFYAISISISLVGGGDGGSGGEA